MTSERFLIEIQTWDWNLFVGLSPPSTPATSGPEGQLLYTRGVDITGVILAPEPFRSRSIRIWLSPLDMQTVFGSDSLEDVGRLHRKLERLQAGDLAASLFLPETALDSTITCLSSIWRYVHIWADQEDTDVSSITNFCFSRNIPADLS